MYKKHTAYGTTVHTFEFDPELYFWTIEIGEDGKLEPLSKIAPNTDYKITWSVFDWKNGQNGYGRIQNGSEIKQGSSQYFPTVSFTNGKLIEGDFPLASPGFSRWRKLIENGVAKVSYKTPGNYMKKDARSAVAHKPNGNILLVTVEGDDTKKAGMTCLELGRFLVSLGCDYACDGDGGGSTGSMKDGKRIYSAEGRAVAGALAIRKKTFVEIVKSKFGCGYCLTSQGEILTKEMLDKFVKLNGKEHYYFDGYSAEQWIGKQVFDCSGLIVWALQKLGLITGDYRAKDLYEKMTIHVSEPQVGDLAFRADLSHVGIYIGNGCYLHARGTKYGVVITDKQDFTLFGRLKVLNGGAKMRDWNIDAVDFVKKFQKKFGLEVDGLAGDLTFAQLERVIDKEEVLKAMENLLREG